MIYTDFDVSPHYFTKSNSRILNITWTLFKGVFFITGVLVPVPNTLRNKVKINIAICVSSVRTPKASLDHATRGDLLNHPIKIPHNVVSAARSWVTAKLSLLT